MSWRILVRYQTLLVVGGVCFLLPVTLYFLTQLLFLCPYTVGIDDYLSGFFKIIGEPALGIILVAGLLSLFLTIPLYIVQKGYSGLRVLAMTLLAWVLILGVLFLYLASMNFSWDKGSEAYVRASLSNVSADIERSYTEEEKFGVAEGDCSSWTIGQSILDSLQRIDETRFVRHDTGLFCSEPDMPVSRETRCYADTESYAISTLIYGVSGPEFYCMDSAGNRREQSTPIDGPTCEK